MVLLYLSLHAWNVTTCLEMCGLGTTDVKPLQLGIFLNSKKAKNLVWDKTRSGKLFFVDWGTKVYCCGKKISSCLLENLVEMENMVTPWHLMEHHMIPRKLWSLKRFASHRQMLLIHTLEQWGFSYFKLKNPLKCFQVGHVVEMALVLDTSI